MILFGNAISLYSGLGTLVVIAGVFGYNKARQLDAQRIQRLIMQEGYPQKIAL
jgi:drug/metabolite transporter (DMT)-like permease